MLVAAFSETPGRYLLEVDEGDLPAIEQCLAGIPSCIIGRFNETGDLTCTDCARSIDALRTTWSNTIRW